MNQEPIALYFGAETAPVFGWFHAAAEPSALGLVLCGAFGREELSAHRSWRGLAHRAANAGWPTLRFDPPCSGDSAGDALADDACAQWLGAVHAAIDELRRLSGVERVVLVGLRSGALPAWQAALAREDVAGLGCVAPVSSGRAWVRELKALEAASQAGAEPSPAGVFESGGFVMSEATRLAISEIDLRREARVPTCPVLLIDRAELPSLEAWARELAAAGASVQRHVLPGFEELMLDPHRAQPPQAMWDDILAWLPGLLPAADLAAVRRGASGPVPRVVAQWGGVREEPVGFDVPGGRLQAVLSRSADGRESGCTVLLLNAGATRRIGPSRMNVELARAWAQRGHRVVRLDQSGLGDSPALPGRADTVVYSPSSVQEVRAVIEQLRAQPQTTQVHVLGLCSGAYHGFKAAAQGAPVDAVIAINPLTFFWHEGMSLDAPLAAHKVADDMTRYRSGLFDLARWRKLASGGVDLGRLQAVVWHAAKDVAARPLRELARMLHLQVRDDLAVDLRAIVSRGARVHFMIAEDDPGEVLLRAQAGRLVDRLERDRVLTLTRFADAGHVFFRCHARRALVQALNARIASTVSR